MLVVPFFVSLLLVCFQFGIRRELENIISWCLGFIFSSVFLSWWSMPVTLLLQWNFCSSANCEDKSQTFFRRISGNLLISRIRKLAVKNVLKVSFDAVLTKRILRMFSSPPDDTGVDTRVSLLPSLIKVADKYLATFPQCSLWPCCLFQAEEGTKLISCVLPPTYRYWNAVKRLTHQVMCLT